MLESVDGDRELLDELAGTFADEVPGWITALRTAASSGDSATLFRVAHGVTGAVSYFKASGVRQAAADLEAMGREGRVNDVSTAVDRLQIGLLELSAFLGSAPWRR
ncbi:MAG TPA: Hpt domain-containing protein [Candidatus Eisenbacteria bacterium]|nr:Hpt domain-containing protein [Candidatus Eisenbacteria bacterium]